MSRRTQFRLIVALTIVWGLWVVWSLMGQSTPYTLRVIDDVGTPVAGAVVDIGGRQAGTTTTEGILEMEWNRSNTVLEVSASGHLPRTITLEESPGETFDVVLNARILRGRVVDAEGAPVQGAVVSSANASTTTDGEGGFMLRGAEPGNVNVDRPAWISTSFVWDGGPGEEPVTLEPFSARAVHITAEMVSDDFDRFIEMAMTTELNSVMIDLKDESGHVWYESQNATAIEAGAVSPVFDLAAVVAEAHENDLYVIGRLVIFQDPVAAQSIPDIAVWDDATGAPLNSNGQYFLDPTDPNAREYAMGLAVEACATGVDEIQFDYVRFPDYRPESSQFDGGVSQETRVTTITGFLADAVETLHPMGCAVAADIFGFITTTPDDGGIGQQWEEVTGVLDVVSPMLYPSHYGPGWFGFDNPNDNPGEVVRRALEDGVSRLPRKVVVRPWLQDFGYSEEAVRAQIESAESFDMGWMLWNATSNVTVGALDPE